MSKSVIKTVRCKSCGLSHAALVNEKKAMKEKKRCPGCGSTEIIVEVIKDE